MGTGREVLRGSRGQEPRHDAAQLGEGAALGNGRPPQARRGPAEARAAVGGARGWRPLVRRRALSGIAIAALLASSIASARPASAEIGFKLPPPEVTGLLPLAALPLDKPPVVPSPAGVPPIPQGWPELPPARFVGDLARRPVAPLASPRMLACNPVGTVFGVASELVECGRARYQRGEFEAARQAFQTAAQETSDKELQ